MKNAPFGGPRPSFFNWRVAVVVAIAVAAAATRVDAVDRGDDDQEQALAALKQRVEHDYPRLMAKDASDFERVNLIRQWAWSHVVLACASGNLLDTNPETKWYELDAAETFDQFEQRKGGVFCGGTSTALGRLYRLFGYEAWTLNTGHQGEDAATHALNLVKISHDGREVLCLQDAYFNLTYVDDASSVPLDYFELLERLVAGDHESIRPVEPDWRNIKPWPVTLVCPADRGDRTPQQIAAGAFSVIETDYTFSELPDGSLSLVSPRLSGKFIDRLCHERDGEPRWYLGWLRDQGHPVDIRYLFLYPFGVYGADSEGMLGRAQQIVKPAQYPNRGGETSPGQNSP